MTDTQPLTDTQQCQYCGDNLPNEITPLNIKIIDPNAGEWHGYYARYELCSEECRNDARSDLDWLQSDVTSRDTVHKSEVEA